MREIRFRGKSCVTGEWVYGYYYMTKKGGGHRIIDEKGDCWRVDPKTVGQFTGLKDKEGKEIYEGDPLAIYCHTIEQKHSVGFVEYTAPYYSINSKELGAGFRINAHQTRIIGNVHENPELLK